MARKVNRARAGVRFAAATAIFASACEREAAPLPPPPAAVNVVMREYAFEHTNVLPLGRSALRVRNAGRLPHQLILVAIPEDAPPVGELFSGSGKQQGFAPLAILPIQPPGHRAAFAQDLASGRYALVCLVQDADGEVHARKGMTSEIEVREGRFDRGPP